MSTKKVDIDTKSCCGLNEAMSPEQCRAARGWLGWTQERLAEAANVGLSTVKTYENGRRQPIANNLMAIRGALEKAGAQFENDPKGHPIGVRFATKPTKS